VIPKFTVVGISGFSGGFPLVSKWDVSTGELPRLDSTYGLFGVTTNDANGIDDETHDREPVAVMMHGRLTGVDDSAWSVGDVLWGDPANFGAVTNVRPSAPLTLVRVGVSMGGGVVEVNVVVIPAITELTGVAMESPIDLDVLVYDAVQGCYVPRALFHSRLVTVDDAALPTDNVIQCDASGGAMVLSLPPAYLSSMIQLHVKKVDATANTVTITPDGTDEIEGEGALVLRSPGDSVMIQCDGAGWVVLSRYSGQSSRRWAWMMGD
jgi:hypothetical protein